MKKVSLYIFLILIFLGLSKSFAPSSQGKPFVYNEQVLPGLIDGGPVEIILEDAFKAGFLIKTYFQRYRIIHGFKALEIIVVRTSNTFYNKNIKNIGMSLFRRKDSMNTLSLTPMPPGSLFIGDPTYGTWKYEDSGLKIWKFHRAYKHYYDLFSWGNWRPSFAFYQQMLIYEQNKSSFYGLKSEFGTNGFITKEAFPQYFSKEEEFEKLNLKLHLKNFISIPFQREVEIEGSEG